jgi:hypothetical protein
MLTALLFACNRSKTDSEHSAIQANISSAQDIQLDFIKTFEGQVNNKYDIVLKISSDNGEITGNYFYKSSGIDIKLKGNLNREGKLSLSEFDSQGNQTGIFNGTMANNNKIEGNWSKPNGKKEMIFLLLESNAQYESLKKQITDQKYESITGHYDFENNSGGVFFGSIDIKYSGNNKFKFEISTGHESGCTGEATGIATFDNNRIGRYSGEACKLLSFNFSSSKLIIDESDCQLHGARCSFAGEYLKSK